MSRCLVSVRPLAPHQGPALLTTRSRHTSHSLRTLVRRGERQPSLEHRFQPTRSHSGSNREITVRLDMLGDGQQFQAGRRRRYSTAHVRRRGRGCAGRGRGACCLGGEVVGALAVLVLTLGATIMLKRGRKRARRVRPPTYRAACGSSTQWHGGRRGRGCASELLVP